MPYISVIEKTLGNLKVQKSETSTTCTSEKFSTTLFNKLLMNAQNNCSSVPQGRRHSEVLKKFGLSVWLTGGSSAYKLLHANMPEGFPSLSTVEREAKKRYTVPCEGEFLFDKLLAHLEAYSAERIVSISEDATRVVSRVEYLVIRL